jgi:hypothetical protein
MPCLFIILAFQKGKLMNNTKIKKLRKQYRKQIKTIATNDVQKEVIRLARNRDILGLILILENIALIVLFIILILPLIK